MQQWFAEKKRCLRYCFARNRDEGRNFNLPSPRSVWYAFSIPSMLEQRIGRRTGIGQKKDINDFLFLPFSLAIPQELFGQVVSLRGFNAFKYPNLEGGIWSRNCLVIRFYSTIPKKASSKEPIPNLDSIDQTETAELSSKVLKSEPSRRDRDSMLEDDIPFSSGRLPGPLVQQIRAEVHWSHAWELPDQSLRQFESRWRPSCRERTCCHPASFSASLFRPMRERRSSHLRTEKRARSKRM